VVFGIPRFFHIAPVAAHIATANPDKIGSFPGVPPLTLKRIKLLHYRQHFALIKQSGIHFSVFNSSFSNYSGCGNSLPSQK
jgi:hypothetical protein